MDEYDEMYGIEDDFEQQFADELEVMAEMERKLDRYVNVNSLSDGIYDGLLLLKVFKASLHLILVFFLRCIPW